MRENKNGARIKSLAQKMLHTSTTFLDWVPWLQLTSSQYALNKAQDNDETQQSKKQCKSTKDCQRPRMVGPHGEAYGGVHGGQTAGREQSSRYRERQQELEALDSLILGGGSRIAGELTAN